MDAIIGSIKDGWEVDKMFEREHEMIMKVLMNSAWEKFMKSSYSESMERNIAYRRDICENCIAKQDQEVIDDLEKVWKELNDARAEYFYRQAFADCISLLKATRIL